MKILELTEVDVNMLTGTPRGCLDDCEHGNLPGDAIITGLF